MSRVKRAKLCPIRVWKEGEGLVEGDKDVRRGFESAANKEECQHLRRKKE